LKGGKFFNNKQIFYNFKLNDFLEKKIDGFKNHSIGRLEQRLEISTNYSISLYKNSKWLILNNILDLIIPNNKTLKKRRLINIYFLDFIGSYRGYRHSFGLPVNGQRTWTNSKTTFSSNSLLRNYKMNAFKKSLLGLPVSDINNAFYLEQLNFLWKSQWELEWFFAKKKRLVELKKSRGYIKFDVSALSKINPNVKDKKKQSLFSIGFDPGFTKFILKNNIKSRN
jgi:ribosomal protein S13